MNGWSRIWYFLLPTPWIAFGIVWATAKHDLGMGLAYEGLAVGFAVLSWLKWRHDKRQD